MNDEPFDWETGRIVKFTPRSRGGAPFPVPDPSTPVETDSPTGEADDYHHRMTMNLAAAAVVSVLIAFGLWLADQMADFRAAQECLTMGARGACAAIQVSPQNR